MLSKSFWKNIGNCILYLAISYKDQTFPFIYTLMLALCTFLTCLLFEKIQRKSSNLEAIPFLPGNTKNRPRQWKGCLYTCEVRSYSELKGSKKAESKKIASWMYIGRSTKECNQQLPFFYMQNHFFCSSELYVWQQCFWACGDVFLSLWLLFISDGINRYFQWVRTVIKILWVLCLVS